MKEEIKYSIFQLEPIEINNTKINRSKKVPFKLIELSQQDKEAYRGLPEENIPQTKIVPDEENSVVLDDISQIMSDRDNLMLMVESQQEALMSSEQEKSEMQDNLLQNQQEIVKLQEENNSLKDMIIKLQEQIVMSEGDNK